MRTLLQAGARVQQAFERRGWQFCFIGGVANFRWGTPRLTSDLDLTLLTGFGGEAAYAGALLDSVEARSFSCLLPGDLEDLDLHDLLPQRAHSPARPRNSMSMILPW